MTVSPDSFGRDLAARPRRDLAGERRPERARAGVRARCASVCRSTYSARASRSCWIRGDRPLSRMAVSGRARRVLYDRAARGGDDLDARRCVRLGRAGRYPSCARRLSDVACAGACSEPHGWLRGGAPAVRRVRTAHVPLLGAGGVTAAWTTRSRFPPVPGGHRRRCAQGSRRGAACARSCSVARAATRDRRQHGSAPASAASDNGADMPQLGCPRTSTPSPADHDAVRLSA